MKKLLLSVSALFLINVANATMHGVTTSGSAFIPSTINAAVGDTVGFVISSGHSAQSITQAAWTANQTSPTTPHFTYGGPGGGLFIIQPSHAGTTIYFICTVHAGMGMKGVINVAPVDIEEASNEMSIVAYPNPAENFINLKAEGMEGKVNVRVLNILGEEVVPAATVDISSYRINLTAVQQGTYFIRIENGDKTKVIRFTRK